MVKRGALIAIVLVGCQGTSKPEPAAKEDAAVGSAVAGFGSAARALGDGRGSGSAADGSGGAASGSGSGGAGSGSAGSGEDVEPITDPGKTLADLGAVPAWQAVVDRTRYLDRRKQHGVAYGLLGDAVMVPAPPVAGAPDAGVHVDAGLVASPYVWLLDDTEGTGALAIRARLPDNARVHPVAGDRVALGGAWALDDDRRWYWKVDAITALPAAPPQKPPGPAPAPAALSSPGHVVATGDMPSGAHTISIAKEGELAYFQLVGPPPAGDGDGWPVADELGNPVYALLVLPGERASYGAQDLRTPDERWALRRGVTYVVRIGHVRKHEGKPATITARTAPVRVL